MQINLEDYSPLKIESQSQDDQIQEALFYGQQFQENNHYEILHQYLKDNQNSRNPKSPALILKRYSQSKGEIGQNPEICQKTLLKELPLYDMNFLKDEESYVVWVENKYLNTLVESMHHCFSHLIGFIISYKTLKTKMDAFKTSLVRSEQWTLNQSTNDSKSHDFNLDEYCMDDDLQNQWSKEYKRYTLLKSLRMSVVPSDYLQAVIGYGVFTQDYDYYADTLQFYRQYFNEEPNPAIWHPIKERHNQGQWVSLFRLMFSVMRVVQCPFVLDTDQIAYYVEKCYTQWNGKPLAFPETHKIFQQWNRAIPLEEYKFWAEPIADRQAQHRPEQPIDWNQVILKTLLTIAVVLLICYIIGPPKS